MSCALRPVTFTIVEFFPFSFLVGKTVIISLFFYGIFPGILVFNQDGIFSYISRNIIDFLGDLLC